MAKQEMIMSLDNPLVKRIRRLQDNARYRLREEAFWAEGTAILRVARMANAKTETVVVCKSLLSEGLKEDMEGTRYVIVSEKVFRHVSQRNNPDGLGAICNMAWHSIQSLPVQASDVIIAAEHMSDPGNLGTILRTMDGVQASALVLVGRCAQPFHPRAVRASRGAVFTVPLYRCPDIQTLLEWAMTWKIQAIATSAKRGFSFWSAVYRLPVLLLFGNEHRGLDAFAIQAADQVISIPMGGRLSSLNVSVAASLVLFELKRRGLDATG